MDADQLRIAIQDLWARRESLSPASGAEATAPVDRALHLLDTGQVRVAEPGPHGWVVHEWLKQAVLLSFRLTDAAPMPGIGGATAYDKVPMKTASAGPLPFRMVPGAIIRRSAYVAPGVVVMPSFINVGAYVGAGSMIDTWCTIGSCAQIGRNCHVSGGVGIGGVLEPLQAAPVIIEDDCFIGARCEVAEGVLVERGAVLSMGVFLGASTRIVDRATGEVAYGRVPAGSVVVPGALPGASGGPALNCAVIVKRVDERTRSRTSINELLRD